MYPEFFLIRPIGECAEIAFSTCEIAENEHCETLKKQVYKLHYHN